MVEAVIFDMDGVLVDSEPITLDDRLAYFAQIGLELTPAQVAGLIGRNLGQTWPALLPDRPAAVYAKLTAGYHAFRRARALDYGQIVDPAARPLMQWLKAHGLRVAIASASDQAQIAQMAAQTQLAPYLDVIISGLDFVRSKPDPAVYQAALRALDLNAEQAIAVEDSQIGIQAARAAGLRVAAVPIRDPRLQQDQSAATWRVASLSAITALVQTS
ncbi:HAD family hydrolase [Lacticaseibacillus absianus]|uniref:HAD family hydrolase n=1 Tax=Lacticaseibacillus absianus TaxID=2729623 RepID=UPI0015CD58B9|nr:HAD family phosphatase [Lacticaseibacillus absianus]